MEAFFLYEYIYFFSSMQKCHIFADNFMHNANLILKR